MKTTNCICGLCTVMISLWLAPQAIAGEPLPRDWMAGNIKEYEAGIDREVFIKGKAGAYIKSTAAAPRSFGTVMQEFSAENYLGKRVRMTAFVKADRIEGWAGLWMRVDGVGERNHALSFDNMQKRPIKGTLGWKKYHIVLDVPENSEVITFGILLSGTGHAWLDEFKFDIVGKDVPVTGTTKPPLPKEPLSPGFEQEPDKRDVTRPPKGRGSSAKPPESK